jgi:lipopolysaccharide transport system permease protein
MADFFKMKPKETITYSSNLDSLRVSILKLLKYRNLIWVFAKRDLRVKYAQTSLGIGWSVFKPLLGLIIYVSFFGLLLNWNAGNIPYPVYVLSGLVGWNLFLYIVGNGVLSVSESSDIIQKIYFPKSILPLSKTVVGIAEALVSMLILVPLLIYYEISLSWRILFIPLVLLYNVLLGLCVVFVIASVAIKKRDILQVLPFLLNMAIWFTPVFFTVLILPEKFRFLMNYNPLANMVELWRWVLFEEVVFQWIWAFNFLLVSVAALLGFYYYSRQETNFTDFA